VLAALSAMLAALSAVLAALSALSGLLLATLMLFTGLALAALLMLAGLALPTLLRIALLLLVARVLLFVRHGSPPSKPTITLQPWSGSYPRPHDFPQRFGK
jgi:tetrahydromethanopterin S-methyltransferase subunit D